MSTKITNVKFNLYRLDTNEIVQSDFSLSEDSNDGSLYTYSGIFNATENSSFGLDSNSFKVKVLATDEAGNNAEISYNNLQSGANSNDFSMAVRVKERKEPYIEAESGAWPSTYKETTPFIAKFITYDKNSTYRVAGINRKKLTIVVKRDGTEIDRVEYSSDAVESTYFTEYEAGDENTSKYRITYTLPGDRSIDGTYDFSVTVWDNDDNTYTFTNDLKVDTTAPSVTLTSPSTEPNNTGNFTVSGRVDDESTVTIIVIRNGEEVSRENIEISEANGSFSKDYTNQPDGNYSVKVYATDASGNLSETIVRNFIIDTLPPAFKSVKFFAINDLNTPVTELIAGQQYKIVVTVE